MGEQMDLFAVPPAKPDFGIVNREGWEARALSDMLEAGSLVCCFPGFMGAVCEGLVRRGLADKEPAGFLDPPNVSARKLKAWGWKAEDYPQFRYTPRAA